MPIILPVTVFFSHVFKRKIMESVAAVNMQSVCRFGPLYNKLEKYSSGFSCAGFYFLLSLFCYNIIFHCEMLDSPLPVIFALCVQQAAISLFFYLPKQGTLMRLANSTRRNGSLPMKRGSQNPAPLSPESVRALDVGRQVGFGEALDGPVSKYISRIEDNTSSLYYYSKSFSTSDPKPDASFVSLLFLFTPSYRI